MHATGLPDKVYFRLLRSPYVHANALIAGREAIFEFLAVEYRNILRAR